MLDDRAGISSSWSCASDSGFVVHFDGRGWTYKVGRLLLFVALLIGLGLVLVWFPLQRGQGLPALTKNFADLTCEKVRMGFSG